LNWNAPSTGALSYDVDYKPASSLDWINVATATTSTSANLNGLSDGTDYNWRVRANCSGGSGNFVTANFTTTAVTTPCPGPDDVSSNGTTTGAATIPLNTDVKGLINPKGDVDYYRFQVTTGGTITLTLRTLPANYQLALHNGSGAQFALSQNNGTADEIINATVTPGFWYARVFAKGNISNGTSCYTLRVSTGTATKGGFTTAVSPAVHLFPNPASKILNVQMTGDMEGAKLAVYDIFGRKLQQRLVNTGNNTLDISKLSAGIYLVKVEKEGVVISVRKLIKQ
jgi:hypothetical protein